MDLLFCQASIKLTGATDDEISFNKCNSYNNCRSLKPKNTIPGAPVSTTNGNGSSYLSSNGTPSIISSRRLYYSLLRRTGTIPFGKYFGNPVYSSLYPRQPIVLEQEICVRYSYYFPH